MKLRIKLLIWITLAVILTIAWLGYISLVMVERLVLDQTATMMQLATKQSATEIEKWIQERQVLLTVIATDLETEKYEPNDPRFIAKFHALQHSFPGYYDYIFIGFENRQMNSTRQAPLPHEYDPTTRPWFKAAQGKKGFIITEPYPDRLTGNLVATFAMPVATPIPGVLGIDIDLDDMTLLSSKAIFHPAAEIILLSQNNFALYSSNENLVKTGNSLGIVKYAPLDPTILSPIDDRKSFFQIERANTKYIVLLSPISTAHWNIAIAIPTSVLYTEQRILMERIIMIAVLSVLIIFTIVYYIISKVTRPLANLASTAQKLEAGDMNVRFQASESFEAINLAKSLDKMRSKLLGSIEEKDALLEETTAQNREIQALYRQTKELNNNLSKSYQETNALYTKTIQALSDSIEAKDPYTHGHSNRVLFYSEIIGTSLGWDRKTMEHLRYAAILHDIGKIGIPEGILNKSTPLTFKEWKAVKLHPALGAKILQNIPHLEDVSKAILQHHEHFAGGGYPSGIAGNDISPLARVLAVADAYDAMTSARPYRPAATIEKAYDELQRCAHHQLDPEIVKIFCEALPEIEAMVKKKESPQ